MRGLGYLRCLTIPHLARTELDTNVAPRVQRFTNSVTSLHMLAKTDQDCPTVSRFDSIGQSSPKFAELRRRWTDSAKPNDSV
jgi:hypothetical protein